MSTERDPATDQKLPVGNHLPHTHDLAIGLLEARKIHGMAKYGQPLQPANGRSFAQDAMEEAADLLAYLTGLVYESEHPEDTWLGGLLQALIDRTDWRDLDLPDPVRQLVARLIASSPRILDEIPSADRSWG